MAEVIGEIIGLAVGIAISPIPIAAVILMLFAANAKVTGLSFLLGWLVGITLVVAIVLLVPGLESETGEPSTTSGVIKGVLGLLLLGVAIRQWSSRPEPGAETPTPKWMVRVDTMGAGGAVGLGMLLTALNPKNLVLAAAAGAAIGAAQLGTSETIVAATIFIVLASVTIAVPVLGYVIAGDRIRPMLDSTKDWMIQNNAAVMSVLLLVFGVVLIGDAIGILLA